MTKIWTRTAFSAEFVSIDRETDLCIVEISGYQVELPLITVTTMFEIPMFEKNTLLNPRKIVITGFVTHDLVGIFYLDTCEYKEINIDELWNNFAIGRES